MSQLKLGETTPVLIVGAGPVGLVAAIRLRLAGIQVRVIEAQQAEAKRTYPVVLHPRTLQLLTSLGLSAPLAWRGRYIKHLAVYSDNLRRVVLDVPSAEEVAPGAMTLPQDVLRQALMQRLTSLGAAVEWQTCLVTLEQDCDSVKVELVQRERVEGAAPSLKSAWHDVAAATSTAEFVIGADGRGSTVRAALGATMFEHGEPETYLFYDAPDRRAGDEAHLVFAAGYGNSVYPLQGGVSRFSFRVAMTTSGAGRPSSNRRWQRASETAGFGSRATPPTLRGRSVGRASMLGCKRLTT